MNTDGHRLGEQKAPARQARWMLALAVSCALSVQAQEPLDITETWTDPAAGIANWSGSSPQAKFTRAAEVSGSLTNGYLNIGFVVQSYPSIARSTARTLVNGIFITNIVFRFRATNMPPSAVRLCLKSGRSGNEWYVNLRKQEGNGWVTYEAPVDYSAGWVVGPCGTRAQFVNDILSVESVGVYVRRNGSCLAQNYGIDDFRIQGVRIPQSVSVSGIVYYDGEQGGPIRVSAAAAGGLATNGATVTIAGPGGYQITGLKPLSGYVISAYRDSNSNSVKEFWEAAGEFNGNPAQTWFTDLADINVGMNDPKDGAGVAYWWLKRYFNITGPATNGGAGITPVSLVDSDGDGMNNYAEYRAGTDPNDPNSLFQLKAGVTNETAKSSGVVLQWNSLPGRSYSVLRATSLMQGFTVIQAGVAATPPANSYEDTTATNAGPYFYRIRIEQ